MQMHFEKAPLISADFVWVRSPYLDGVREAGDRYM